MVAKKGLGIGVLCRKGVDRVAGRKEEVDDDLNKVARLKNDQPNRNTTENIIFPELWRVELLSKERPVTLLPRDAGSKDEDPEDEVSESE